jgi:hypothetical protein
MEPLIADLLRNGVLGLVIAALLSGWLAPKWVLDEYRRRLEAKDATIERQARVIERLASRGARLADVAAESPDG